MSYEYKCGSDTLFLSKSDFSIPDELSAPSTYDAIDGTNSPFAHPPRDELSFCTGKTVWFNAVVVVLTYPLVASPLSQQATTENTRKRKSLRPITLLTTTPSLYHSEIVPRFRQVLLRMASRHRPRPSPSPRRLMRPRLTLQSL
jgi:hypothetical protein